MIHEGLIEVQQNLEYFAGFFINPNYYTQEKKGEKSILEKDF
jgi:hypothetical protein